MSIYKNILLYPEERHFSFSQSAINKIAIKNLRFFTVYMPIMYYYSTHLQILA